ncbi:unnamed protein product [Dovyalis caffra]|uniref:Uncharacterized protein n=1 Tax=Dovyalis caffra TaxID=77055 RepID=A0AAV1SGR7_9ROSI|nr:unnamed protein product [Dovyalis caffra]
MLDQWNHNVPVFPPAAPSPDSSSFSSSLLLLPSESHSIRDVIFSDVVPRYENRLDFDSNSFDLPAPWDLYSIAESINGCCLCFVSDYTILKIVLILLEAALVAFIAIDRRWEKDLPFDPTGELQSLRTFIEENVNVCEWVGITVLVIQDQKDKSMFHEPPLPAIFRKDEPTQCPNDHGGGSVFNMQSEALKALALLLAMILRAMVSTRRNEFNEDDYENARGRTREPLLNQSGQTFGSGTHSDVWSSRMREKYGLNTGDNPNLNQNASMSMKSK